MPTTSVNSSSNASVLGFISGCAILTALNAQSKTGKGLVYYLNITTWPENGGAFYRLSDSMGLYVNRKTRDPFSSGAAVRFAHKNHRFTGIDLSRLSHQRTEEESYNGNIYSNNDRRELMNSKSP